MGGPSEFGQWYYLIYLLPGGVAMLLLLLSAAGGGGRHHRAATGHHGHRMGGGHRHGGPKHHSPKGAGARAGGSPNLAQQMLAFFGVGRVPGPFVWGSFLLGWGLFGFWGTRLWESALDRPGMFFFPALVTALAGALAMAKLTGELGARLLPKTESFALSTIDLCGQTGTVAFPVDEQRGRVNVYDAFGTLHAPSARVAPGQALIARGRRILVTDYDAARDMIIVEELP